MATEETTPAAPAVTAASRYAAGELERQGPLNRAREMATLTIPGLMPPPGATGSTILPQPFQSTGADGVNNLSAKLMLVLFPTGSSFVRLRPEASVEDEMEEAGATAEVEEALRKTEKKVMNKMESRGNRTVRAEAAKHLIVTGNALIHILPDNREKFFALDRYVVFRDLDGNVLEIVVKEELSKSSLPQRIRDLLQTIPEYDPTDSNEKSVCLYTWIKRDENGKTWSVHQEVEGREVPGSRGTYPSEKPAWLPLRWSIVSGQAYGRGRCEEYGGDLRSLEGLTKAIVRYAIACSKIIPLVNAGGTTKIEDLMDAESGEPIEGREGDVHFLSIDKFADFQVAKTVADKLEKRLEKAFLLATSVQRDAERVTAEEIRAMIGQLEESLGSQYTLFSEEWQRPSFVRHMHEMQMKKELPALPEGIVSPQIVAGLEGLGRNSDLNKLDTFIAGVETVFGPQALSTYVNPGEYMRRRATALGVDAKGLVRTDAEVQAAQEAAQRASLTEKVAPQLVDAGVQAAQGSAPAPTQ